MNDNVITKMHVKDNLVKVMRVNGVDYISLTDLASYINPNDPSGVIRNWMSTRNSFSFYSLWEELSNPDFNSVKSHGIKIDEVPYNRFTMTPNRWKLPIHSDTDSPILLLHTAICRFPTQIQQKKILSLFL